MAAKKTTRKKTTKQVSTRGLVLSVFTGEKAYKWRCKVGDVEIECINKVYTTASRAEKAGNDWVKENLK